MRRASLVSVGLLLSMLVGCGDDLPGGFSVFVYTRQTDWIHPSNPVASAALAQLGADRGWDVTVSDDPGDVTEATLARTSVVVFSVTSGNILEPSGRDALGAFLQAGGGFVGIHSASHTEWEWPFYLSSVVPVVFRTHPHPVNIVPGTLTVEAQHEITAGVPPTWMDSDEFYSFYERPEDITGLQMLLALDESTMGPDYTDEYRVGYHPLAFVHELTGGRTFYTALGHTEESYADPVFMGMVERAIEWAGHR